MAFEAGIVTATIANGDSLSAGVHLKTQKLVAIQMPAAWTSGNLTFQGSFDGTTYADVYDDAGTEVTVTAGASRYILCNVAALVGFQKIKVRSGTTGTPVAQGGARDLQLILLG